MKRIMLIIFIILLTGCGKAEYNTQYLDVFDTYTTFQAYCSSQQEFDEISQGLHSEMTRLNKLFDIYNDYEGISNLKAINDNAGKKPVSVDKDLYELIKAGVNAYDETDGYINIAMGSVLKVWHNYREEALASPEKAAVPSYDELSEAARHTDIGSIILDDDTMSVYISDKYTSIDPGAIAKGYAADRAREYLENKGVTAALLNLGGNVICLNDDSKPLWKIGVQKPEEGSSEYVYKLDLNNKSAVSSGNYQRYYMYNGKVYHHIIDKNTLMPADNNKSVTIVSNSSLEGDIYSTYLFILPYSEGSKIAEEKGFEAVWVDNEDKVTANVAQGK